MSADVRSSTDLRRYQMRQTRDAGAWDRRRRPVSRAAPAKRAIMINGGRSEAIAACAIVVDWDGTVTERDTLLLVLQHFVAPAVLDPLEAEVDAGLAAGTITHREVMEREWHTMTAPLDDVVAFVVDRARVRPGFAQFVQRFDPLILSSGFHETIEPLLAREGVMARVRANHAEPRPDGWRIRWVSDSPCEMCGQPCKRRSLPDGAFTYIGDGFSDRCAALAADRVFARDGLARYLDSVGRRYESFTDFRDLADAIVEPVGNVN